VRIVTLHICPWRSCWVAS